MKQTLIFLTVLAVGQALPVLLAPTLLETGASTQFRTQDNIGNYAFGYNEDHTTGGTFRRESGDVLGNKIGSYGLRDADGRARVVNYIADGAGFRADIKTNEPGVDPSKDPANTAINKATLLAPAPVAIAPSPLAIAPAPLAIASAVPSLSLAHSPLALVPGAPLISYGAPLIL